jgi:hypothetical protein
MLAILFSALAFAAPVRTGLSLGLETVANDPFLRAAGPRLALSVRPRPWIGGNLAGSFTPYLGEGSWTAVTRELVEQNGVYPDISAPVAHARLLVELVPVRTTVGSVEAALVLGLGGGLMYTVDDLTLTGEEGDPVAEPLRRQVHPSASIAVASEVRRGAFGARVRLERSQYVERIGASAIRERKRPTWVGAEVVYWFDRQE